MGSFFGKERFHFLRDRECLGQSTRDGAGEAFAYMGEIARLDPVAEADRGSSLPPSGVWADDGDSGTRRFLRLMSIIVQIVTGICFGHERLVPLVEH